MKPEVEMYFTNPIDLSKKYYTQLSQVKHSQTDNRIKYIIFPSLTISILCKGKINIGNFKLFEALAQVKPTQTRDFLKR